MAEPLKSTSFRIEGTKAQIDEALLRLTYVFTVSNVSKHYESRHSTEVKRVYCRCYTYDKITFLDQLQSAQRDIQHLQEEKGELELQLIKLREQLNLLPQPREDDAVLSPNNKKQLKATQLLT